METDKGEKQVILSCTYAHQPFLSSVKGKPYLLFCYAFGSIQASYGNDIYSYTPWKLAIVEWGETDFQAINTGFTDQDIHCCPVLSEKNNQYLLTFTGGVKDEEGVIRYSLYAMQGSNLAALSNPQKLNEEFTFCGFQNNKYQIRNWREPETEILDLETNQLTTVYIGTDVIQRIVPVEGYEDLLLVTVRQDENRTFLYKVGDRTPIKEILVNNQPVYKSCFLDGTLVYAKQTGEDFEQRQLFYSDYELSFG